MFDRYTESARRALFFARFAVSQHGPDEIAPEHLLLGLLGAGSQQAAPPDDVVGRRQVSISATLLRSAGVTRAAIEGGMQTRSAVLPTSVEIPFSAATRRCLEDAMREADQMGTIPITTGHLLLGLLQADGTAAATTLHAAGVRLDAVRVRVATDVAAGIEGEPPTPPANLEKA